MGMARGLKDGLLRFCNGAWRDDDGDAVDIAEVVRCKDCWKSAEGLCSYQFKDVPGKDFCGDGERKDNDNA